jgi:3'-5' exoribonuclease 1
MKGIFYHQINVNVHSLQMGMKIKKIDVPNISPIGFFSPWDFAKFLRIQCGFNSIPYPRWAKKWINLRKEFSSFYSVQRCGMKRN